MRLIGGNIHAKLQSKSATQKNAIGEVVPAWVEEKNLFGFLDYSSGDSRRQMYDAKIQESTHIFLCDYTEITKSAEECRMIINNKIYDVLLIDNPMELCEHLEIYLRYTGG